LVHLEETASGREYLRWFLFFVDDLFLNDLFAWLLDDLLDYEGAGLLRNVTIFVGLPQELYRGLFLDGLLLLAPCGEMSTHEPRNWE